MYMRQYYVMSVFKIRVATRRLASDSPRLDRRAGRESLCCEQSKNKVAEAHNFIHSNGVSFPLQTLVVHDIFHVEIG